MRIIDLLRGWFWDFILLVDRYDHRSFAFMIGRIFFVWMCPVSIFIVRADFSPEKSFFNSLTYAVMILFVTISSNIMRKIYVLLENDTIATRYGKPVFDIAVRMSGTLSFFLFGHRTRWVSQQLALRDVGRSE